MTPPIPSSKPAEPLLQIRGLSKVFPGVRALDGVDFTVRRGEVHALMGENGAGKSTLIKVLTGVYPRDGGSVTLGGAPFEARSPGHAQDLGVSTVYQEVNLVPYLSVAENISLGRQPRRFGRLDWRAINRRAEEALRPLELRIDVTQPLNSYSIAIQQMVAIARALDASAQLLILDEPTSSLDADEVARLFAILRRLKADGLGIVFVTHFLDQVYEITDRITVLRNGRLVGEYETAALPRLELITKMIGKSLDDLQAVEQQTEEAAKPAAAPFLQARGLARKGGIAPFDLDIAEGEVVGLAGLLGSGRTEIARLLFGLDKPDAGETLVDGQAVMLAPPRRAIRMGFGFLPEDRKTEAIIPDLSIRENIILAMQAGMGWARALSRRRQEEIADYYIRALRIATPGPETPIKTLSGGNQQKVILARWLASQPRFLILDEPTRGIDVGSRAEIEHLIADLSREGKAILMISSELDEIVRCSHRIAVLRDRVKIAELGGAEKDEQSILRTIAARDPGTGDAHAND